MAIKKIACIGGGSLFFSVALKDLAVIKGLEGSEIVLFDLDNEKSLRMMGMGKRIFAESGADFRMRVADKLADALQGADYVIASIGGTGVSSAKGVYGSYYHGSDMYIPGKYGVNQIIGDTCGPAGMMMAFRTIPAYYHICKEMDKYCPGAVFFNHSNPMAVLCKALNKYTGVNVIGLCHGVQGGIHLAAKALEVSRKELECIWVGTNHYYWFIRVSHKGKDVTAELLRRVTETEAEDGRKLSALLSKIYGYTIVYRDDSHLFEFYPYATQILKPGAEDKFGLIERALHYGYDMRNPSIPSKADAVAANDPNYYDDYQAALDEVKIGNFTQEDASESMAELLSSMANGRRSVCIVNVPNKGSIPNLPADAIVEVEGVTDSYGVRNLYMGEAPAHLKGILEKRFVWHDLVADAAIKGDRNLALQALLLDEMSIMPDKAQEMLEELLIASKELLPQFKF